MRVITRIFIHCTATQQSATVDSIKRYWRDVMKWNSPGYHFLIAPDGTVHNLQPIHLPTNGVVGYNANSIHISYIGGVDAKGKPIDNRTPAQVEEMINLISTLRIQFPKAEILGHRDVLQRGTPKWKDCPSFDVKTWLKSVGLI